MWYILQRECWMLPANSEQGGGGSGAYVKEMSRNSGIWAIKSQNKIWDMELNRKKGKNNLLFYGYKSSSVLEGKRKNVNSFWCLPMSLRVRILWDRARERKREMWHFSGIVDLGLTKKLNLLSIQKWFFFPFHHSSPPCLLIKFYSNVYSRWYCIPALDCALLKSSSISFIFYFPGLYTVPDI